MVAVQVEELDLIEETRRELREQYYADERAWVVAFSGGKDSTLVLQLVYEMLVAEGARARKPVYVISSDTLVEPPNVADYVERTIQSIQSHAAQHDVPIEPTLVRPEMDETFWAKLIGKGYPPPTRWFRWCTTNMKIKPSRREIAKLTREHGSVILLLGSRSNESSDRRKRMLARSQNERRLNPHHEIPDAFVFTPIADWETDEVWEYLYENNPPPWGGRHDAMLTLYRQASGGECPIVMDLNTPSCGGSRFGCWTCTVVRLDRSMEGFIEAGERWMAPLNRFRNWLKEIREGSEFRMNRRRDGSPGPGPFTPEARKQILRELLSVEKDVGRTLIRDRDIAYIQAVWSSEFDLRDSALEIARSFGREIGEAVAVQLEDEERQILEGLIEEYELSPDVVGRIMDLTETYRHQIEIHGTKAALQREITAIIETAVRQAEMADPIQ